MKKIIALLLIVSAILLCTGCSLFQRTPQAPTETDITIYNDETSNLFKVKYGEIATVTAYTKVGYYLTGYFSEPTGGALYFDASGNSINEWNESNPAVFYAQWAELSQLKKEVLIERYKETSLKMNREQDGIYFILKIPYFYNNAAKGNSGTDFIIQVTGNMSDTENGNRETCFTVKGGDPNSTGISYASKSIFAVSEMKSFSLNMPVKHESIARNELYLTVTRKYGFMDFSYMLLNNFIVTLEYVKTQAD